MNNNSMTKDIKDLNSGILPDTLNFSLTQRPFDIKDLQKIIEKENIKDLQKEDIKNNLLYYYK
jgi:hypothetical protein